MIIAIDGTSSSGKSSISKALGAKLDVPVLGTGSLYRAIAYKMLTLGIKADQDDYIKRMLETTTINLSFNNDQTVIYVDGLIQDLNSLNSHEVSVFVAHVAQKSFVREFIRNIQYQEAKVHPNIIVEGRDIGSVVFPNAEVKLFVDADLETRAKRRMQDYSKQGKNFDIETVIKEIEKRDIEDTTREHSPLTMTSDAIIIDTSDKTLEQSVNEIINLTAFQAFNID